MKDIFSMGETLNSTHVVIDQEADDRQTYMMGTMIRYADSHLAIINVRRESNLRLLVNIRR